MLLLHTRGQLINISEISVRSPDSSIVHPRETVEEAISPSTTSAILVHNHPSGDPEASEDDVKLTERLTQAGRLWT